MSPVQPNAGIKLPSNAEITASVEAIGRLHHLLKDITDSLVSARSSARALVENAHALPGGIPREAALAIAKLRLELAHDHTLTLDTLRSVVESIPVPDVHSGRAPPIL